MKVAPPAFIANNDVELATDGLNKDERIVGWVDEMGTIRDGNGEIIGDLVAVSGHGIAAQGEPGECSALVLKYRGDQMSRWGWSVGDKALLDNKVAGKIDGFYRNSIVFQPNWAWGRGIWGRLDSRDEPTLGSEDIKHTFLGIMLVHPSNLSRLS